MAVEGPETQVLEVILATKETADSVHLHVQTHI